MLKLNYTEHFYESVEFIQTKILCLEDVCKALKAKSNRIFRVVRQLKMHKQQ